MEDAKRKASEEGKDEKTKEPPTAGVASKAETKEQNRQNKNSGSSSNNDQDLDVFLLGDLGDSDDGAGA